MSVRPLSAPVLPCRLRFGLVLTLVLAGSGMARAEVYKWTDANGQVHFSDRPPPAADRAAQKNLAQVSLTRSGPDFSLQKQVALQDSGSSRVPLVFTGLSQKLAVTGESELKLGQLYTGAACEQGVPLSGSISALDLGTDIVTDAFHQAGWEVLSGATNRGDAMRLSAELSELRIDQCGSEENRKLRGARAYARLRWLLVTADGKSLFRGSSEGARNGWGKRTSSERALRSALAMAAHNLLANRAFNDKVREQRMSAAAVSVDGSTQLPQVQRGNGVGGFAERKAALLASTLRVQAGDRIGSAVVIDLDGFALSSARLVGEETHVLLMQGLISLPAAVVKRDLASDVALLRFVRNKVEHAAVAPLALVAGAELHLISAPASAGSSNVIGHGQVSTLARTDTGRQRVVSTLLEKNGNAGAPAFDRHGDLVGLATLDPKDSGNRNKVSALQLVPIGEALQALGIPLQ